MNTNGTTDDSGSARLRLDDGSIVRSLESVETVVGYFDDGSKSDWVYLADPGDEHQIAVRVSRVVVVEEDVAPS
jgi:hypothetical protein